MGDLLLKFKDDSVDISIVNKVFNTVRLKFSHTVLFYNILTPDKQLYNEEDNITQVAMLLKKKKIKNKKANIILDTEGIITRVITIPLIKKREIRTFIDMNIEEYFSVNIDEYFWDYKLIDIEKGVKPPSITKEDSDEVKDKPQYVIHILLAIVSKQKVNYIRNFIKKCSLEVETIGIYAGYMTNVYGNNKKISTAVLDVGKEKSNITIFNNGNLFLYSSIPTRISDEESLNEYMDSFGYFLDFFATRNFGGAVDEINILGDLCEDMDFCKKIEGHFNIPVVPGINSIKYTASDKKININKHIDAVGFALKNVNIYKKEINYEDATTSIKSQRNELSIIRTAIILGIITLFFISSGFAYERIVKWMYNIESINSQLDSLKEVESTVNLLSQEKKNYEAKQGFMKEIEKDTFPYMKIIATLNGGLPPNITVKSIALDAESLGVNFGIQNSTLDAARLITAINNMGIFNPIDLDSVRLDDNVTELGLRLVLKKESLK